MVCPVPAGGFLGWLPGRRTRVRRCTECGTTWTMPGHSESPGAWSKGIPLGELYSAARLLSNQTIARGLEDAEVRNALSHCPQCGSGHFIEIRKRQ
jgi:ribosomal protein S27AE